MKYSNEQKEKAIKMLMEGVSYKEVSEKSGAATSTLKKWLEKEKSQREEKMGALFVSLSFIKYIDLIGAYKKLKVYFYNDTNMLLNIRVKLAEFESEILTNQNYANDDNFKEMLLRNNEINQEEYDEFKGFVFRSNDLNVSTSSTIKESIFEDCIERKMFHLSLEINQGKVLEKIEDIKVIKVLKSATPKLEEESEEDPISLITSNSEVDEYKIKHNFVIDMPIELHIISTLWVMTLGLELDKNFYENSYGQRLDIFFEKKMEESIVEETYKIRGEKNLFKKYYTQYKNWRNDALSEVRHILDEDKEDSILINLDIKKFFYNTKSMVVLNLFVENDEFWKILDCKSTNEKKVILELSRIVDKINEKYKNTLEENEEKLYEDYIYIDREVATPLPIGALSSMVLGNYALKKIDKTIMEVSRPNFYGRYVDDIILVYKLNGALKKRFSLIKEKEKGKEIIEFFLEDKVLEKSKENSFIFKPIEKNRSFIVQKDKFKIFIFKKDDSRALLDTFENNVHLNASAFNFLPEEDELIQSFNKNALSIQYNGSPLKVSDIDGLKDDKLKFSIYLSKAISLNKYNFSKKDDEFGDELLVFFKGEYIFKYSLLWEKVFTYFVTRNNFNAIELLYIRIFEEISKIKEEKFQKNLEDYLNLSLSLALSLNKKIINDITFIKNELKEELTKNSNYLISSNMLRHRYVYTSLVNYIECSKNSNVNFYEDTYGIIYKKVDKFELSLLALKYSPRYIHLNEFILFYFKESLFNSQIEEGSSTPDYLKKSFEKFNKNGYFKSEKIQLKAKKFCRELKEENRVVFNEVISKNKKQLDKVKIGLGNFYIPGSYIEKNLEYNQQLTRSREQEINRILNEAKKEKVDIVILPEVSIPFQWIDKISEFSRKNDIAIICGVEHIKVEKDEEKIVYNQLATILPFNVSKGYKTTYIKFRLKNYYSPGEKSQIKGRDFNIPEDDSGRKNKNKYDLFLWKGVYFTVFNCFELTSIRDRSMFQGYIDFLIASVYNPDTNYFKDILDSTSRDLHCYAIQSNTSNYGDSMILQPSKTQSKEILRFKGGENGTLVISTIDIKSLRKHQIKNHLLQKGEGFKPTPPGYTTEMAWRRIKKKIGDK